MPGSSFAEALYGHLVPNTGRSPVRVKLKDVHITLLFDMFVNLLPHSLLQLTETLGFSGFEHC